MYVYIYIWTYHDIPCLLLKTLWFFGSRPKVTTSPSARRPRNGSMANAGACAWDDCVWYLDALLRCIRLVGICCWGPKKLCLLVYKPH